MPPLSFLREEFVQLYTDSISDREIVLRSGFLSQKFEDSESVMADEVFQIQDILPLGVHCTFHLSLGETVKCLLKM